MSAGKAGKTRLDMRLVALGLAPTRQKARALIQAGSVRVCGELSHKPSRLVLASYNVELIEGPRYVGRGGDKLESALDHFGLFPRGLRVLDIGISTGGFTDCLLQRGAAFVTGVDVGYGQVHLSLRNDPRVTLKERTNARYLKPEDFPEPFDLLVADVSFISLEKILPAAYPLIKQGGEILALVKPQFEAERGQGKKGIVRDQAVHTQVLEKIARCLRGLGCNVLGSWPAGLPGAKGNQEYFIHARC